MLADFSNEYTIEKANIRNAHFLDPNNENLKNIDFKLDVELDFKGLFKAEIFSSREGNQMSHSEAVIEFEDGAKVMVKEVFHQ